MISVDARVSEICAAHAGLEGPLLPIFHAVQAEFGHIPASALDIIAKALQISRAEAYGVQKFYHDFKEHPQGRHVIRLCRAEACQAMGGAQMIASLERALGVKLGETKNDLTLEAVYCLGLCACAPAAEVNGELIGRADAARIQEALV